MTQSPMTRRTLFALGAPAALVTIAACSKSSSGTSNSTTSKSVSTPDRVVSFNWPEITETKLRDDTGYHLNKLVDGAPTVTLYTDYEVFECAKAELAYEKAAKDLEGTMNVTVRRRMVSMRAIRRRLCWPLRYKVNTWQWRANSVKPRKNGV